MSRLCETGCPETAITMETGLDLGALPERNGGDPWETVYEAELFECRSCGTPFASVSTVEDIKADLPDGDMANAEGHMAEYCSNCKGDLPLLGEIPMDPEIRARNDADGPLAVLGDSPAADPFEELAIAVADQVGIKNRAEAAGLDPDDPDIERSIADELGNCCDEDVEQRLDELQALAEIAFSNDGMRPIFAILGNETRYRIARTLAVADDELCVCKLEPLVDVSESAVSHALSDLVDAGLITRRKEGNWRYYGGAHRAR